MVAAFKPKSGMDVERKLIRETLDKLGENRKGLYRDPERMDAFITALDKRWQSYFKRYQKDNGTNPPKPQLFKTTGTHTKNLVGKLQATPAGGGERQVMRDATRRAIELLSGVGYNIDTADFQALMWYPEKRLFRSLGVKGGRGEDNDYLDAATLLAKNEGISDDKIQEALPDSERGGVDPESNTEDKMVAFAAGLEGLLTKRNQARMSPDSEASTSKPRVIKDYKILPELPGHALLNPKRFATSFLHLTHCSKSASQAHRMRTVFAIWRQRRSWLRR